MYIHTRVSRRDFQINESVLQGGEVLQETITANVTEEWVSLEFQRSDGTLVTQILDFKNVSSAIFEKLRF